jgi:hypothetical protein
MNTHLTEELSPVVIYNEDESCLGLRLPQQLQEYQEIPNGNINVL